MIALALALQLFATTADAAPGTGSTPIAPGAPRFAQLSSLVGVPGDSSTRVQFLSAFRGAFASDELPGERLSSANEWRASLPLPNHFRLLEGDVAEDAWRLEVSIGSPSPLRTTRRDPRAQGRVKTMVVPSLRTSRGMLVALTVQVPNEPGAPGRTVSSSSAFYFPADIGKGVSLGVPETGYRFPWGEAGRIAGTLVLEILHHESGDLVEMERMDIKPAVRATAPAPAGGSR